MIKPSKAAHLIEMLFHQNAQEPFILNVYDVENLFEIRLRDAMLHEYIEIHQTLRQLGVVFSYMTKSDTCGFQRLFDINKWEMLKPHQKQHFHNNDMQREFGHDHLAHGIGIG